MPCPVAGPGDDLEALGKLALRIVLDFSVLAETPETALACIELFESLAFFADLIKRDANIGASEMAHKMSSFIGGLPLPEDYRICAELASAKLAIQEKEWKQSRFSSHGIITNEDFSLAKERVASLYHAAGPDFAGSNSRFADGD